MPNRYRLDLKPWRVSVLKMHVSCTAPFASGLAPSLSAPQQHLGMDGERLPHTSWSSHLFAPAGSYANKEYFLKRYTETSICQSVGGERVGQRVCVCLVAAQGVEGSPGSVQWRWLPSLVSTLNYIPYSNVTAKFYAMYVLLQ